VSADAGSRSAVPSAISDALASENPAYLRGVLLVAMAGVFWSLGGVLVRWVEAASAWQIIFYRSLALALTLALIVAIRHRGRLRAAFAGVGWNGLVAGVFLAGGFAGFIVALTHTTVANTVFMLGVTPFVAAVLGWWWLGERVRRATWLAMMGAAAGVGTMVANGIVIGTALGNLIALGTAFCFATFSVLLRRGREQDMLPCVAYAGIVAFLVSGLLLIAGLGEAASAGLPGLAVGFRDLLLCLIMGSVQVGTGLTIYTLGARHVPAAELTLLSLTELALAPIWVWLAVGEVPTPPTLVGGGIIMTAIAYQALSGARRRRTPAGLV
jgi:drug/metabolite transporter (DMT)-like permease